MGDPQIVSRLLQRGADPVARSGAAFDMPELEERFAEVAQGPYLDAAPLRGLT